MATLIKGQSQLEWHQLQTLGKEHKQVSPVASNASANLINILEQLGQHERGLERDQELAPLVESSQGTSHNSELNNGVLMS